MKKFLPLAALVATSSLCAHEEMGFFQQNEDTFHLHHFSPVAFYKKHREGKYNYEFSGVGVKYFYAREKGLNLGINILSNLEADRPFIETETYIGTKFKTDYFYFVPKLMSKNSTHQVDKTNNYKTIITKGTTYGGIAISPNFDYPLKIELEGFLFRDLYNTLLIDEGGRFHGAKFVNPFGFRSDLNIHIEPFENFVFDTKVTYSQAFKKEYWEVGCQIGISWRY